MRLIDKIYPFYHIRLRNPEMRDDILVEVDKFLEFIGLDPSGDCNCIFDPDLDDSIQAPFKVGGIDQGTLVGDLRGLNILTILEMILFPPSHPIYTAPSANLQTNLPEYLEVGSITAATFIGQFIQNDAGPINNYTLREGANIISNGSPYTISNYTSAVPVTNTYRAEYAFDDGIIKNDFHGNPDPTGRIQAGTILTNQLTVKFIYPIFYGTIGNPVNIDLTSALFLTNYATKAVVPATPSIDITMSSPNVLYLWFAVPASTPDYTEWKVNELNQGFIGQPTDLFGAPQILPLSSNMFSNVAYKLYVSNYATQQSEPFNIK